MHHVIAGIQTSTVNYSNTTEAVEQQNLASASHCQHKPKNQRKSWNKAVMNTGTDC